MANVGRPRNKEKNKKEKIINLGLFVRDSDFYINFENLTNGFSNLRLTNVFCEECSIRDSMNTNEITKFRNFKDEINNYDIVEKLEKLERIDKFSYFYYSILFINLKAINRQFPLKDYEVNNVISLQDVINALGDEYKLNSRQEDMGNSISLESLTYDMPIEDKQKLLEYCIENNVGKTFINHESIDLVSDIDRIDNGYLHRVHIELDLTKPKEELLKYIEMIKNDYDEDPNNISTVYNILGATLKDYKCELDKCDIYKFKNPKPINGRLADILFIYDCRRVGLKNEYIIDEIDRYWQDIKNLYKDNFTPSTLSKYYKVAIKYIDNQEYKSFISGYDIRKK